MGESSESTLTTDQQEPQETKEDPELNPQSAEESPAHAPKKKKKKKKDKVKEEEAEEAETVLCSALSCHLDRNAIPEVNGNEAGEKRKKKKKEKHLKEENEEVEVSPMEVHGSDSSGYLSDKPSKKRKHEITTNVTSSFRDDCEPTKPKKKRKSGIEQFA